MDYCPEHSTYDFQRVMWVNLTVPFMMGKAVVQQWIEHGDANYDLSYNRVGDHKRIINVGSMGIRMALRTSPGYCASKAGLEALTRVWAKEFAGRYNIATVTISPGGVDDTNMIDRVIEELQRTRGMTKDEAEAYNRQSPLGRNCTHREVAEVFDFAVNHLPIQMSGSELYMPGGMGIR